MKWEHTLGEGGELLHFGEVRKPEVKALRPQGNVGQRAGML